MRRQESSPAIWVVSRFQPDRETGRLQVTGQATVDEAVATRLLQGRMDVADFGQLAAELNTEPARVN